MAEQRKVFERPEEKPEAKGFSKANEERIRKDEEELEALLKEQSGEAEDPEVKPKVEDEPKTAEERTFKKRYGDLRRHMDSKVADLENKIKSLEENPKAKPPVSAEEIEKWVKENPQVARIVETIADQKANEKFESTNTQLAKFNEEKFELEQSKAEDAIRKAHKDFDSLRDDDAFHVWADEQPKWVQDALYENADDPGSVIRVIDLYKLDVKGKSRSKDSARDSGARSSSTVPSGKEGVTYSESKVNKMSSRDYEKHEDAIMQSMQDGTFVYDMSGAR